MQGFIIEEILKLDPKQDVKKLEGMEFAELLLLHKSLTDQKYLH